MKRWPLLLPPPAVSTSPSRSRRSLSSIVVKSPSRRSSPSSCCRRAVHRHSAAPSITVHSPSCCPSPLIAVVLLVHCRRARAVPCRRGAAASRPSPSRSCRTVPCRRGAIAPSLAVEEPSRRPSPSRSRRAVHCRQVPYLAIKEPSAVSTDDSDHSSRPSNLKASRPAGCRVASPHSAASHLPAPFIAAIPFRASRPSGCCPVSLIFMPPSLEMSPTCRDMSATTHVSLQFWPDGSVSPTQN
jgi:hypothetical protein